VAVKEIRRKGVDVAQYGYCLAKIVLLFGYQGKEVVGMKDGVCICRRTRYGLPEKFL